MRSAITGRVFALPSTKFARRANTIPRVTCSSSTPPPPKLGLQLPRSVLA